MPLLIAAQIVFTWGAFWNLGLYISGETKAMAHGSVVLVPITLLVNYLLIPKFGNSANRHRRTQISQLRPSRSRWRLRTI